MAACRGWGCRRCTNGVMDMKKGGECTVTMTNQAIFTRVAAAYDLTRMKRSRIIAVGCGGARSFLEDMARAGVGQFLLIDPDVVDEANIGTQHVYLNDIGRPKVDCIADRIIQINPQALVV